jgi:hypothetical protein
MGRKPKLTEAQQAEARKRRAEGATLAELARSYGVGKSTISRLATQIVSPYSSAKNTWTSPGFREEVTARRRLDSASTRYANGAGAPLTGTSPRPAG